MATMPDDHIGGYPRPRLTLVDRFSGAVGRLGERMLDRTITFALRSLGHKDA